jgi:hypothetical protein
MSTMNKPIEYLCQIDSGVFPSTDSEWDMVSPDLTVWRLTISTAGVLTVTSGGAAATSTPFVLAMNGSVSLLTISNAGVLTIASSSTLLTSSDSVAALIDSNTVSWLFLHLLDGQLLVSTETPLENLYYYPAIMITFETSAPTDVFELHAVKPNISKHRR